MATENNPKTRENNIVVQNFKREVLIYDLTTHKAYCLNETSAMVWNLCDGKNSVTDISRQISRKLKQPVSEDIVWLALDQLKEDNLLDKRLEIDSSFNDLSRREVIRKVGFASMIALPVISSIIAPTAAQAVTCIASGQSCSSVTVCCSTLATCPIGQTCP